MESAEERDAVVRSGGLIGDETEDGRVNCDGEAERKEEENGES